MTQATKTFADRFEYKVLNDEGEFEGHGSVFGNTDLDGDVIEATAFDRTLKERPIERVKLLWMHRHFEPIGRWMDIQPDSKGLAVRGKLTLEVQRAKETYALMKDNAVDGLSIGFRTKSDEYDSQNNIRKIKDVDLFEISVVPVPANDEARVNMVKSITDIATLADAEAVLREVAGFSNREATAMVSRIKAVARGDHEGLDELVGKFAHLTSILKQG